jgi:hypothetical protein
MSVPVDLEEQIEDNRITYSGAGSGVTLSGAPFLCEFDTEVNPREFCDTISTPDPPWEMFGATIETKPGYFTVAGCLYHTDGDGVSDSSKITLEVCSEWVPVYVKEGCSIDRVVSFVEALDDEYGVVVRFGDGNDSYM